MNCYDLNMTAPWYNNKDIIKKIVIEDGVTSIGDYAFWDCDSLTDVVIGSSVTSISNYAFCSCDGLTNIEIPLNVTDISYYAFFTSYNLTTINVDSNNNEYSSIDGVLFNKDKTELICCPNGKSDFYKIPDSITSIGTGAFSGCSNLTAIEIPVGVINIGRFAFFGCNNIVSISIPSSITTIADYAFNGCYNLANIYYNGTNDEWTSITIGDYNEPLLNAQLMLCSISVSSKPLYIIGEDNDLDITVNLNNNDGTSTTLSPDDYTIETDFDPTTEGEYTVKVIYGDFTDEITVKVEPLTMTSISVTTQPDTTSFTEGTDFDLSGMVVTGTYNNDTETEITDYEVSGYDNSTVGNQTLTISYNDLTATLPITVVQKSISGIRITSLPDKTYYDADETELDLTGLSVETLYNNGTTDDNTSYTVSGFDGSVAGTQTITVSYSGFTDTFEVFVKIYEYKIDSTISKSYDFDTKTLAVGTNITSRTDAGAVKVIIAVYDSNGVLMNTAVKDVFFDTNEIKDLSIDIDNVEYPFDTVRVFVWDYDLSKMIPLALSV